VTHIAIFNNNTKITTNKNNNIKIQQKLIKKCVTANSALQRHSLWFA